MSALGWVTDERRSLGKQDFLMDQVARRFAGVDRIAILFRQQPAAVDEHTTCGRKRTAMLRTCRLLHRERIDLGRAPRPLVVVLSRRQGQIGIAANVALRQHGVNPMIAIRADESPTPIVERIAELSHSGHRLGAAANRVESKIAAADIDGRTVGDCPLLRCPGSKRGLSPLAFRIVRRPDPAALLTVGNVDSVVQSEQWIADS